MDRSAVEFGWPVRAGKGFAMLWKSSATVGFAISAKDGALGTVSDMLFDDSSWMIRWLVVDTGGWLSGRKVLLPPSVLEHMDATARELSVTLTKKQIEDSPEIDTDQPVSRQAETNIYDHYGWTPYWGNGVFTDAYGFVGGPGALGVMPSKGLMEREAASAALVRDYADPHLRSVGAVTGYHVHATDGEIGHVKAFLVDDKDWKIAYLIVDTRNWWPGKEVLISPLSVLSIEWREKLLSVSVDRQKVRGSPEYGETTTVDGPYGDRFEAYYHPERGPPGQQL